MAGYSVSLLGSSPASHQVTCGGYALYVSVVFFLCVVLQSIVESF